jgi:hypothetical protein
MDLKTHKKIGNNAMPNSLMCKKYNKNGGYSMDELKNSIGDVTRSITDNSKQLSENLQNQFNRFLNNSLLVKDSLSQKVKESKLYSSFIQEEPQMSSQEPQMSSQSTGLSMSGGKKHNAKKTKNMKTHKNKKPHKLSKTNKRFTIRLVKNIKHK